MSVKLSPSRIIPPEHACYYLTGDDEDAVFEIAEALLADGSENALLVRVDVTELARIHENLAPGLFGESRCHAMVRNAASARPKQIDQLEKLAANPPEGLRLILCAPGIESKKALHKRLTALPKIAWCAFPRMDETQFLQWLEGLIADAGLTLSGEAMALMGGQLQGMRLAAKQAVERLRLYDDGEGAELDVQVVGDLLGERSPRDLAAFCNAVGERSSTALSILRRLLRDQQVSEIQALSWLSTRIQQLLMYSWYVEKDHRSASSKAHLFGEAKKRVPQEAKLWQGRELIQAMEQITRAEMLLKGASVEDKPVVLERLTLNLVNTGKG
ncbi:MAG: DNA polymerase III subunit delta [Mariprofundaceae bacterium]|nr:DNA polymerase III subunit delta [Mariprofundaceae bacterium]